MAFDALNKSVQTVHESLATSQESDGQAILNLLKEQQETTTSLVQTIYSDLDTKMKHFREEMSNVIEKLATTVGNQSASVRRRACAGHPRRVGACARAKQGALAPDGARGAATAA